MEERKKERRVRVEVEEEKEMQQAHFKAKPVRPLKQTCTCYILP